MGPTRVRQLVIACVVGALLVLLMPTAADGIPGVSDCKEAPTPEVPGRSIAGFFAGEPARLPRASDPFAKGATTTIYEQYGFAGLRWHTYDLGCGPDAMRQPDAVIGTAMSNWMMQIPLALTALTGSVTQVAFQPTFLGSFDNVVSRVSSGLHDSLFASWIPFVLALIGVAIIIRSRRASMSSGAAAVGWALFVILITTALFRWPVEAGRAADASVIGTLGAVANEIDGNGGAVDPGTAVASAVVDSILYRAWLAGTLGSADSATARRYGPDLFRAHALTWREAATARGSAEASKQILEQKQTLWKETAEEIATVDPEAYEHLTGRRSETRVGFAILSATGSLLALPFLLLSALLMLGCFLIVRLAVMLFPAFATIGAFPTARGVVRGLGTTVAAALINAVVFGIGACVAVAVLGLVLDPGGGAPAWLGIVLMPVFSFIMWMALRPFRRLTTMVSPNRNYFGEAAASVVEPAQQGRHLGERALIAAIAGASGGAAAGAIATTTAGDKKPERAESLSAPMPAEAPTAGGRGSGFRSTDERHKSSAGTRGWHAAARSPLAGAPPEQPAALPAGFVPRPMSTGVPPPPSPIEPMWDDEGDLYFLIYRPGDEPASESL
jgi:hypothetical protein